MSLRLKFATVLIVFIAGVFVIFNQPTRLGLDLQGGIHLILEAQETDDRTVDKEAVIGAMEVIRNRIDSLGVSEPQIRLKGQRQIEVELPGIKEPQRAIDLIGDTALLEFIEAEWPPVGSQTLTAEQLSILAGPDARLGKVIRRNTSGQVVSERAILLKKTQLTGADLKHASPATGQLGELLVNIEFTKEGAEKFHDVTRKIVGKPLAITLDGTVISAPNVNEPISGGRAQISGQFSLQEMKDLVIKLKAGALPVPVELLSNKIVGPTLGKDVIQKSRQAGLYALVFLFLFMLLVYRFSGLLAIVALTIYLTLAFATLKLIGATLTLPGIAGFILTMGMAVDANVIIFERIKEEVAYGYGHIESLNRGFKRAFVAILDANMTTLIASGVLFLLGTGSIKGFSVTLTIGIMISMFSALFVTQCFMLIFPSFVVPPKKSIRI